MTLFKNDREDIIERYDAINDLLDYKENEIKKFKIRKNSLESEFDKKRVDTIMHLKGYGDSSKAFSLSHFFLEREKIWDEEKLDFLEKNKHKLEKNYYEKEINNLKKRLNNENENYSVDYKSKVKNSYKPNEKTFLKYFELNH